MRSSSVYTARLIHLLFHLMCLVMELFIVLPRQGNQSLYPQANPKLKFVELTSFDDIPENIIYNKSLA